MAGWVAVGNYVGFVVCLRNSQWWCLMIILVLGSFAKGVYMLHNHPFMLKIPILHFWATSATVRVHGRGRLYFTGCTEKNDIMNWHQPQIDIQRSQACQVIEVRGGWVGMLSASHGSYHHGLWSCFHFVWCSHSNGLCAVNVSLPLRHHTATYCICCYKRSNIL